MQIRVLEFYFAKVMYITKFLLPKNVFYYSIYDQIFIFLQSSLVFGTREVQFPICDTSGEGQDNL